MKKLYIFLTLLILVLFIFVSTSISFFIFKIISEIIIRNNNPIKGYENDVSFRDIASVPYIPKEYSYKKRYNRFSEEVDLSNIVIDDNLMSQLIYFPRLRKIKVKNPTLSADTQLELEEKLSNIEFEWNISICNKIIPNDTTSLDLSKCIIKDLESFKKSLSLLHNLEYLDMSDCNLDNETLANLRKEFPNIKIVWKIYLGKWSLKTDAVAFSVLITKFDYDRMKSSDIEVLKYCTDLQALDLGHQSITDISVIGKYLTDLRVLILADNKISNIKPLANLKHLHYLELFMNNISDISPLKNCKELVDLNIAHINTLYDFSPLINNDFPLLERLCIQNSGGTANYLEPLQKKYPTVRIVYTGYGSTHSGWRTHPRYYAMIDMFRKRDYISNLFTMYDR